MRKGFTLIELIIVIGILAILSTVVVLVLNPGQILARSRDSSRMSDLRSIKSAVALYLSTATGSLVIGASTTCTAVTTGSSCSDALGPFAGTWVYTSSTAVNGTGWVPINLTNTLGGSPISSLPLDPTNSGFYFYAYKGENTNKTFEVNGRLESEKFRGLMATDGGNRNTCTGNHTDITCYYEVGTKLDQ